MKKLIIILLAFFLAGGIFFSAKQLINNQNPENNNFQKSVPEKTTFNFLLLGYGGGNHEGTYLTDTMMVAHIDTKTKKATLFSIPRDLWVRLETKSGADFHTKINAIYQMGLYPKDYPDLKVPKDDATLSKTIISQITGLPIDGYVSVNFAGFIKAIDILGGVDVNIERAFTDTEYPIDGKEIDPCDKDTEELLKKADPFMKPGFNPDERDRQFKENPKIEELIKNATDSPELAFPCRYEKLEFAKGPTHMNGENALKYARSRHSETDGGDFNRARRQQQIIEAVKDKVLSIGFVSKIIPLMDEFKKDVKTDIGLDIIKKFISQADKSKKYQVTPFVLTDKNFLKDAVSDDRQFILIPNEGVDIWTGVQKRIYNIIEGITPTPVASKSAALK